MAVAVPLILVAGCSVCALLRLARFAVLVLLFFGLVLACEPVSVSSASSSDAVSVALANRVSGAHLNPAVTLALAVFRSFSWAKVVPYVFAQTVGAFCGAGIVYFNYR
ncbi:MAG: aquaporin, partial [Oscillochloris sp.]|nr:aquaporin [Oscillochloris sp.]